VPRAVKLGPSEKDLEEHVTKFNKIFGEGAMHMGDAITPYEVISTGSLELDIAMGVGGWVKGRLSELYGPDDLGKTTLAIMAMAEAQRKEPQKLVGFIDMEQKLDLPWVDLHGVNRKRMSLMLPKNAEQVADALKEWVTSGYYSFIVLDSVGAMISKAEQEKDADEATMAVVARIMSRAVRVNAVMASRGDGPVVLFINQLRANLAKFGPDTTVAGGWVLKYGTTHKISIKAAGEQLRVGTSDDSPVVGQKIACKIERNKVGAKGRVAEINLIAVASDKYGPIGVDKADEAASVGDRYGLFNRSGAYYTLPLTGERVQGREKLVDALRVAPEVIEHVRAEALKRISSEVVLDAPVDLDEEVTVERADPEHVVKPSNGRKFRGTKGAAAK
jgi:recombination protein RecA